MILALKCYELRPSIKLLNNAIKLLFGAGIPIAHYRSGNPAYIISLASFAPIEPKKLQTCNILEILFFIPVILITTQKIKENTVTIASPEGFHWKKKQKVF